jgi:DNA polymerase theta
VRSAIVPRPGYVLLTADYAALELRLVAHFANDPQLIALMHVRGVDLFRSIARNIYTLKHESDVSDKQRESAKRIVYGLLYGMGAKSLADDLHCNLVEATLWQEGFYKAFAMVRPWMERVKSECKSTGYVVTLCGRKRYLPSISANNGQAIAQAERQAVNTVCQGSAADLVKMAMNDIGAQLASRRRQGKGARLLLQIHDELLLEVPTAELGQVAALVRSAMETAVRSTGELRVPMVVKLKTGASWEQLQELSPL